MPCINTMNCLFPRPGRFASVDTRYQSVAQNLYKRIKCYKPMDVCKEVKEAIILRNIIKTSVFGQINLNQSRERGGKSMAFPDSFLDELTERNELTDVVSSYVHLVKKGSNMFGLCPFHNEKTPSFSVSPSKQIYHCFGCGKGGGVLNFIMEIENLSFPDAVYFLANRVGMTVPETGNESISIRRKRLLELNKDAARYFHSVLKEQTGANAVKYLEDRKIKIATVRRFGLGASPDSWDSLISAMTRLGYEKQELLEAGLVVKGSKGNIYDKFRNRLMFPVIDIRDNILGFGGRSLGGEEPKYLNTPETLIFSKRKSLYGINIAKNTKRLNIILCEGNIDVITLHQAGFDNAVASMGTSLTVEQTRLLARYTREIVICYDNDRAGQMATDRALDILKNSELDVRVLKLPNRLEDGKKVKQDADDFVKKYGSEAFEKLLAGSENHIEYSLLTIQKEYDLTQADQKVEFLKRASELISKLSSPVEREIYGAKAAEAANISADAMMLEIKRALRRRLAAGKKAMEKTRPSARYQPNERSLRYTNVKSATAEEGIIRLILLDPCLISDIDITPEEFSSPFLGKVFSEIKSRYNEQRSLSLPSFSQELTSEEMSVLTHIVNKPENLSKANEALKDYISTIRMEKLNSTSDFETIAKILKEKKQAYGGYELE